MRQCWYSGQVIVFLELVPIITFKSGNQLNLATSMTFTPVYFKSLSATCGNLRIYEVIMLQLRLFFRACKPTTNTLNDLSLFKLSLKFDNFTYPPIKICLFYYNPIFYPPNITILSLIIIRFKLSNFQILETNSAPENQEFNIDNFSMQSDNFSIAALRDYFVQASITTLSDFKLRVIQPDFKHAISLRLISPQLTITLKSKINLQSTECQPMMYLSLSNQIFFQIAYCLFPRLSDGSAFYDYNCVLISFYSTSSFQSSPQLEHYEPERSSDQLSSSTTFDPFFSVGDYSFASVSTYFCIRSSFANSLESASILSLILCIQK